MNVIVTAAGAVSVPGEIYEKVVKLKAADKEYGKRILYVMAIPKSIHFKIEGRMPEVKTYEEFEKRFLQIYKCPKCGHPGLGRNIIV